MVAFPDDLRGRFDRLSRFSDETSLDARTTQGVKVPIYASVPADSTISWYHDLRTHFPNVAGEVKSVHVLQRFDELAPDVTTRVWSGLREVSIHVSDPRQYLDVMDEAFRAGTGRAFSTDQFRANAEQGNTTAAWLLRERDRLAAELMLSQSVESRLESKVAAAADRSLFDAPLGRRGSGLQVEDFQKGRASLVRTVAEYTAKGSAAFAPAHERARTYGGEAEARRFWMGPDSADLIGRGTLRELEDGHAFDRGDRKALSRLEHSRRRMVKQLLQSSFYSLDETAQDGVALIEMESSTDSRIQAADVAAGLARHILAREGLVGVVKRWEVVYYNGSRVTERNLEATLNFWRRS